VATRSYRARNTITGEWRTVTETYTPRYAITFRKRNDDEYPGVALTGTEREIRDEYEFFLSLHSELTPENFVEVSRREI
jgi:hypothetical protein